MKIKKVLLGVAAAGLVGLTFSTTTYAWFRINSTAYVEDLEYSVITGLGFKVAVDGSNVKYYKNTLTTKDIESSILRSYNREKYVFIKDNLHEKTSDGYRLMEQEEIEEIIKENIILNPLTSLDGIELKDQFGDKVEASSGRFLEFDMYFKTLSDLTKDNLKYGIHLTDDTTFVEDGSGVVKPMKPTSVNSILQPVKLANELKVWDLTSNEEKTYEAGSSINLNVKNAIRFSYENKGKYESSNNSDDDTEAPVEMTLINGTPLTESKIYEITDSDDLGSYATDYNGDDSTLKKKYDYRYNAMYTYNQSLGGATIEPLSYNLISELYDSKKIVTDFNEDYVCAKVESGIEANLVTFRFWIEGYDADYIAGIPSKATDIKVNLSFKVNDKLN